MIPFAVPVEEVSVYFSCHSTKSTPVGIGIVFAIRIFVPGSSKRIDCYGVDGDGIP